MQTPNIDRLAHEGALFERAFHTTPICSPNRASIVTGQYASRHGIIDNVARDAMSHRLPNYHLELQKLGYETAHIGKWHMGNDGMPRPGLRPLGELRRPRPASSNPTLNHDGTYVAAHGLHHRHHERARGRLPRAQAREALLAVLRAQGGASGRRAGGGRHVRRLGATAATSPPSATAISTATRSSRRRRTCCRPPRSSGRSPHGPSASRCEESDRARAILDGAPRGRAGGDPASARA